MQSAETRKRIARLAPTFACWDLLEYAAITRPTGLSLELMARQIGRSREEALPALAHFVAAGVLRETHPGSGRYSFDPPADVAADIECLIDSFADTSERLRAVTAVLQMDEHKSGATWDGVAANADEVVH